MLKSSNSVLLEGWQDFSGDVLPQRVLSAIQVKIFTFIHSEVCTFIFFYSNCPYLMFNTQVHFMFTFNIERYDILHVVFNIIHFTRLKTMRMIIWNHCVAVRGRTDNLASPPKMRRLGWKSSLLSTASHKELFTLLENPRPLALKT